MAATKITATKIVAVKARLRACLERVQATEELALTASGELLPPSQKLNERKFWTIGARSPVTSDMSEIAGRAVSEDRDA
jgi:hypothetical protein